MFRVPDFSSENALSVGAKIVKPVLESFSAENKWFSSSGSQKADKDREVSSLLEDFGDVGDAMRCSCLCWGCSWR